MLPWFSCDMGTRAVFIDRIEGVIESIEQSIESIEKSNLSNRTFYRIDPIKRFIESIQSTFQNSKMSVLVFPRYFGLQSFYKADILTADRSWASDVPKSSKMDTMDRIDWIDRPDRAIPRIDGRRHLQPRHRWQKVLHQCTASVFGKIYCGKARYSNDIFGWSQGAHSISYSTSCEEPGDMAVVSIFFKEFW